MKYFTAVRNARLVIAAIDAGSAWRACIPQQMTSGDPSKPSLARVDAPRIR